MYIFKLPTVAFDVATLLFEGSQAPRLEAFGRFESKYTQSPKAFKRECNDHQTRPEGAPNATEGSFTKINYHVIQFNFTRYQTI